jgi:ATP-dependent Lon protease
MMTELDEKIVKAFPGSTVRKDLVNQVKGNAVLPSYVLEYLLGQYCTSSDESTIQVGVERVREILDKHYVNRSESELWKAHIRETGSLRVIDKISARLNDKNDSYEAQFQNLGLSKVPISSSTVMANQKMLVSGIWSIVDVEYANVGEGNDRIPWIIQEVKPIQLSIFDAEAFANARRDFTLTEWIDLLIQSIGFNPEHFSFRQKMYQLIRLVPFLERNYNVVELGPKGTGKSHVYSELSPHGMLISGGEITQSKLFVNNSNGRLGLVAYWDVVAFDEFAGRKKTAPKALVDIMKNFMANGSFSRGVETISAEASMAFVGNTDNTVEQMLLNENLFAALPEQYIDPAFLDRMHHYIPGWESDMIRREMFTSGYGFVIDYLAEVMKRLREKDWSGLLSNNFKLNDELTVRDSHGVRKTFSGLTKLLFPHAMLDGVSLTQDELELVLSFAMEGRKRVKDQLTRIDPTMPKVRFTYTLLETGETKEVFTEEELKFPDAYNQKPQKTDANSITDSESSSESYEEIPDIPSSGISYRDLFSPFFSGLSDLEIVGVPSSTVADQVNLVFATKEIAQIMSKSVSPRIKVFTQLSNDDAIANQQIDCLDTLQNDLEDENVQFEYEFLSDSGGLAVSFRVDGVKEYTSNAGLDIFDIDQGNCPDFREKIEVIQGFLKNQRVKARSFKLTQA